MKNILKDNEHFTLVKNGQETHLDEQPEAIAAALNDLDSRVITLDEYIDRKYDTIDSAITDINTTVDGLVEVEEEKKMEVRTKETALPGDIALNATIAGEVNTIFVSAYAYTKFYKNKSEYTAFGIVVIPYNTTTQKVTCMSTKYMSLTDPENGSTSSVSIYWGGYQYDAGLTKYTAGNGYVANNKYVTEDASVFDVGTYWKNTSGTKVQSPYITNNEIANVSYDSTNWHNDTDGSANSQAIRTVTTAQHTTGTAITNSYAEGNYPANEACLAYTAGGKSWYLPSAGELQYIPPRFMQIDEAFKACGSNTLFGHYYWSSTECSQNYAWYLNLDEDDFGNVGSNDKSYDTSVIAFASF